jgi:ribonuclease P protein component
MAGATSGRFGTSLCAAAASECGVAGRRLERLSREHRLRLSSDYALAKSAGTPFRGRCCLLLALARPGLPTRIGFIASKRGVGGAVERNRARRRLREIVRRRWSRIPRTGYWLAFVASRGSLTASHGELASEVERLLAQAGALQPTGLEP